MIPLIVLAVVALVARLLGTWRLKALDSWPAATRVGLAVMFCFTAVAHFGSMRQDLIQMVPAWVPRPELMVTLTGVLEVLGAVGLLVPVTRRIAGLALIAFLVAVFPANVHAAQTGVLLGGEPATPLLPRLMIQLIFIGLTWWSAVHAARR